MAILGIYVKCQGGVRNLAAHCTSCEYLAWRISSQTSLNAQFCSSVSQGLLYVIFKHHKTSLSTMLFSFWGVTFNPATPNRKIMVTFIAKPMRRNKNQPRWATSRTMPSLMPRLVEWCTANAKVQLLPLWQAFLTRKRQDFWIEIYLAKLWYFANPDFHEILENSMPQLPFGVRSCEVVIIWPEIVHQPPISSSWEEFPTIRSGWGGGTPTWHLVSQNEGSQQKTHREFISCAFSVSKDFGNDMLYLYGWSTNPLPTYPPQK